MIGENLKKMRLKVGLTHNEIEEISGIKRANYSAYENNRQALGVETAKKLAVCFGSDPCDLLFPDGFKLSKELNQTKKKRELLLKNKTTDLIQS